jgi:flagellar FliL protein
MAEKDTSSDLDDLERQLSEAEGAVKAAAPAKSNPPAPSPASKKGKKKSAAAAKPEVLWTVRLEQAWQSLASVLAEIFRGLRSKDAPTRRMARLFFVSFIGFFVVAGYGTRLFWENRHKDGPHALSETEQDQLHLGEFILHQAEENKHKAGLVNMGTFSVQLKEIPGQHGAPGVMNLAELEIVLETDSKETRQWIEENLAQARNQITNSFVGFDRDEVLTRDGKKKLKKMLLEKLNTWLIKGKVEDLFFSKLVVS